MEKNTTLSADVTVINNSTVLTKDETQRVIMLDEVKANIFAIQDKFDGLAQLIAGQLYLASENKLYELEGYTGVGKWAEDTFGISSGTASDSIGVFKRFGNKDDLTSIATEYAEYNFSSLISMKKLSDEQIKLLELDPKMSRREIKERVSKLSTIAYSNVSKTPPG